MDDDAVKRAMERIASASESRPTEADVQAALERARAQIESLAQVAAELEETLPQRVGDAVREGVREQAQPLGRQTAEVRGLLNRLIRQAERLETDLLAERNARVDDLGLLVELITSGWRGVDEKIAALTERLERIDDRVAQLGSVDERMARIENAFGRLEKALTDRSGAVVYRIEERRTS
jgi:small-conductance mechanosensitive channel